VSFLNTNIVIWIWTASPVTTCAHPWPVCR